MANMSEPKEWAGYMVDCYDCGFSYDWSHDLEGGGYDCPACNELALKTEIKRLGNRLDDILEENKHLQADLELARLALEEAVVLLDEHKFKDVWAP